MCPCQALPPSRDQKHIGNSLGGIWYSPSSTPNVKVFTCTNTDYYNWLSYNSKSKLVES